MREGFFIIPQEEKGTSFQGSFCLRWKERGERGGSKSTIVISEGSKEGKGGKGFP